MPILSGSTARPSSGKGGILPSLASSFTRCSSSPHTSLSVQGQRWATWGRRGLKWWQGQQGSLAGTSCCEGG